MKLFFNNISLFLLLFIITPVFATTRTGQVKLSTADQKKLNEKFLNAIADTKTKPSDIETLLAKGAQIDFANPEGNTALHSATKYNRPDLAEKLVMLDANVELKNNKGQTAFDMANKSKNTKIANILQSKPTLPSSQEELDENLANASFEGDLAEVKKLLAQGAHVNSAYHPGAGQPLYAAAIRGHTEVVRLLLAERAHVNTLSFGRTALYEAAKKGHTEIVRLLLNAGANANITTQVYLIDDTPLYAAIDNDTNSDHQEIIKLLINGRADVNVLVPNSFSHNTWSPLMLATMHDKIDIIKLLLAAGANIDIKNNIDLTAVDIARNRGNREIIDLFEATRILKNR